MKAKLEVANDLKTLSETLEKAILGDTQGKDPARFQVLAFATKDIAVIAQEMNKDSDAGESDWKALRDLIHILDLACKTNTETWSIVLYSLVFLACNDSDTFQMFKDKLAEAVQLSTAHSCDCKDCRAKREAAE